MTRVSMIPNALQDRHSIHTHRYLLYSFTTISRIVYFFFVDILSSGSAKYICYKRRSGVKNNNTLGGDSIKGKRLYIQIHNSQSKASVIPKYLFAVFFITEREKGLVERIIQITKNMKMLCVCVYAERNILSLSLYTTYPQPSSFLVSLLNNPYTRRYYQSIDWPHR
jgi:hypothetical protein